MTALALLSVIAPAAPSAPTGPSGEDASGFQTLLAALGGAGTDAPEAATARSDTPVLDEMKVETPTAAGFLVSPTPPPPPLVLPAAGQSSPEGGSTGTAAGSDEAGVDTVPSPAAAGDDPDGGQTTTPLPVDKGSTAKTSEPQIQPRLANIGANSGTTGDIPATLTTAANEAAQVIARAGSTPTPPPSSPLAVAAAPAPLRPLADRTSRPVDTPTVGIGDGARVIDPAAGTPATRTVAAQPTAADQPARPADFMVAAAGRDTAGGSEAGAATSDLPPLEEGVAARAQAASATRETAVSQLSRVAIEATAQIAAQILRRLEGRSTRFEMALTPDDLGRVDVKLDIDSEGRLAARLAFDNPAAATDLRGRADELRRQLEEAGFHLADDALEFAERDSGSSAFDRGQDSRNGSSRAFAEASRLKAEIDIDQPPRWLTLSLSPSGVDMKV